MQHITKSFLGLLLLVILISSCAKPIAQFSYDGKAEAPAKIQFQNKSEKADTYQWDFGDGKTSTEESPMHQYLAPGDYTIILKAKKGNKETVTKQQISVMKPKEIVKATEPKATKKVRKPIKETKPTPTMDNAKVYFIEVETSLGNMKIKLYNETPKHRDNILKLAKEGYYDDLLFHRVINDFMVQGGDPQSRNCSPNQRLGSGGPGYQIEAEFGKLHYKGTLAAARTGGPVNPEKKSSGSQFYIVQGKPVDDIMLDQTERKTGIKYTEDQRARYKELGGVPYLDHEYTVYGEVVEGIEVIDKIAATQTAPGNRPVEDIKMKIRVVE